MSITVSVDVHGPLFDGRADHAVDGFLHDAREQVAQQALADWHHNLDRDIKHPTPYYETQLTMQAIGDEEHVHDRGIVYGPWLEGVGSRNAPVTRFKGYAALRRAFQGMQAKAGPLCERVLRRWLEAMNR